MAENAADRILSALDRLGRRARPRNGGYRAQCPAHDGQSPESLSVRQIEGQALVHCFGGCAAVDIMEALGLAVRDLFDSPKGVDYAYTDTAGRPTRTVHRSAEKKFRQSGATKLKELYRLPRVVEAVKAGTTVYLVEGEKDVHALESLGLVATTAPEGASRIENADLSPLKNATVVAIPDKDGPGDKWATEVHRRLSGYATSLSFVEAKEGKDAADHIAAGYGVEDFVPADAYTGLNLGATLVYLADVERERIDWLWPGYLAKGKLHIIDGDPGLGKSTMTSDLAARVTTGKQWPDGQEGCTPAGVVLLSAEDGLGDTIRPRLDAAGADVTRAVALTGIRYIDTDTGEIAERMPALPSDIRRIGEAVRSVGAALVVIDPLMAYLSGDVNSHRDQDVRRALAPLAHMAEQAAAAIILVRHLTKGSGNNAIYRGGGSIGIIGAARIGFAVARDPEDEGRVIVACSKANIAVMPASLAYRLVDSPEYGCARVEWAEGPVGYSAEDLMAASQESVDDRTDRNDAAQWLRDHLINAGGEAAQADVVKEGSKHGFSQDTLKRAKKRAGVISRKAGMGSGWVWAIDPEGSTKSAKGAEPETLRSSLPSVHPSEEEPSAKVEKPPASRAGESIATAGSLFDSDSLDDEEELVS